MKSLYGFTIALSAFLLFSVEPIVTKELLPVLGGSSAVWITALAFFQLTLLAGYGYSAVVAKASSERRTLLAVHLGLLAVATVSLFASPAAFLPKPGLPPQLSLLAALAVRIGVPFFTLSTTAPLLQAWYARREQQAIPYRLFGLSNLLSLAALLSYPTLVEPYLSLPIQQRTWTIGFLLYVLAIATLTLRMRRAAPVVTSLRASSRVGVAGTSLILRRTRLLWLLLPAVASFQLAAVTAHLTENVAAMPLLWIAPLAAYLLSFVLSFELPALYRRGLVVRLLAVLLAALGYLLSKTGTDIPMGLAVLFFVTELLVACWFLHAELFALRPADGAVSPVFYLLIAGGGALGTCAVAILSPLLTRSNLDLPFSFALTAAVGILLTWRDGWTQRLLWVTGTGLAVALLIVVRSDSTRHTILRTRNFYGALRVKETHTPPEAVTARTLLHGTIQHGMQWFSEDFRRTPMSYYATDSGVGLALDHCCDFESPSTSTADLARGSDLQPGIKPAQHPSRGRLIGVVGLGTGTLAAYGRTGDTMRFFEINPLVPAIAQNLFTYTRDSAARISVVQGDARLSLEHEPATTLYDVLVIDAFSGDAIPVHLLTREALALYRQHLAPGGVLAFHISNQYLDLAPVLARLVESTSGSPRPIFAQRFDSPADTGRGSFTATWVLLCADERFFAQPALAAVSAPIFPRPGVGLWTDDYSSLLPILHWSGGRSLPDRPANVRFVR